MSIVKRISCPDCGGVGFTMSFDAVNHIRFENCGHCGGTGLIESPVTDVDLAQFLCSIRTEFINGKNIKAGWCQRRISYDEEYRMTADDFCNYGERKDGAGNG